MVDVNILNDLLKGRNGVKIKKQSPFQKDQRKNTLEKETLPPPPLFGMLDRRIQWGDLVSPRAMWEFTLSDAWTAIPTLLAMGGLFLLALLILVVIKKVLIWALMKIAGQRYNMQKWILKSQTIVGGKVNKRIWETAPNHRWFNGIHILIESMFFVGVAAACLFAAAVGDVNVWQNPIAISVIGIVITYIFGAGLQQAGSGYFFFLNNCMTPGEYWEQIGGGISGRVCNITPFFVEFEAQDDLEKGKGGMLLQRANMTTVLMSNWQRNYYKESEAPELSKEEVITKDQVFNPRTPPKMPPQHNVFFVPDTSTKGTTPTKGGPTPTEAANRVKDY